MYADVSALVYTERVQRRNIDATCVRTGSLYARGLKPESCTRDRPSQARFAVRLLVTSTAYMLPIWQLTPAPRQRLALYCFGNRYRPKPYMDE